nr:MAG TPA: hypothetical protein [Caudoviricetes sp.]
MKNNVYRSFFACRRLAHVCFLAAWHCGRLQYLLPPKLVKE